MSTMTDLTNLMASKIEQTVDGNVKKQEHNIMVPHFIGVTPFDEPHTPDNEDGTILDVSHEFWDGWERAVTEHTVRRSVNFAVHELERQNRFEVIDEGNSYRIEVTP